ncbi:MAG: hypothetical protein A3C85_02720 [Candidatus Doudnabacteria bacterium RIFCSPHIGHO2_02_FULL_48_21]|uniref:Leucine--tRNA ligase n=1 Tax=Candidatus Doudnabacteria bacterium RIFCSPLOWO2_02_FULL_48_13 TaxID=1817845 RepID=A0A1F5Q9J6_9BACT|nr:MAG: hypothetical protein A3K05_03525 [Candidatus Doudnabacteria bacterium RIFCSPHIGHO2_01_48_18]OGE79492.1 MAG: hypothetical protein A2668_00105 [Candidatus Doudnabacteria bacterium RIFCSPHIGHO2_01_FULL_48_180]OGE91325.1 MAG: hypothetical protein A3F44_03380 [Candidatus Doudnabacteria bacterium RIFCSPHIGHO2_12_FULL_47_25]OGE92870.1 MAG: hypothetical protein A3C85_02720 [Candidatus Doudnabacteria bacterium RIFCSPHIGHO2_02_FULL_48_21]OGE96656.1 MAG: hypothetical protein A3A83_01655 [Candidatu
MKSYEPKKLEQKWQKFWNRKKIYNAKDKSKKPKKYILIEFPYPSGEGLHMGHLRPYVAGDVYSRYQRMHGAEVMYPMGWDAFGLPAENFAIKKGVHPSITTKQNIKNAKRQVQSWGTSFDWSREINTTDPDYYKWTQWIFLQFYKAGLAYEATGLINWCPQDKTGLANEEVIDGKCERCGATVEKKELRQWYLKITAYAEKLLEGLKNLPEWPDQVKLQQENWIGKSEGAEIDFFLDQPAVKRFVILHAKGGASTDVFYPWLKHELENKGFEVQVPDMPNPEEPDDLVQAEFVKKQCKFDEQTVVIGHSFGGVVAMRLLEQGIKINRAILIGTPFSGKYLDGKERPTVTAAVQRGFDFRIIKNNSLGFTFLYDTGDHVVPISDGEQFAEKTGFGIFKVRAEDSHFRAKIEPEVLSVALGAIKIFTTRPDTIYDATYMVLAPEHQLAKVLAPRVSNASEVLKYMEEARKKTDIQRSALEKEKTGVELKGIKAINPATGEKIPLWIADYVLMGYGTGAIMAVPAHDERDRQFAEKYKLAIADKPLIPIDEAIKKFGKKKIQYKLRDWVFSRQRYWGEPIPIIHCTACGTVPVPEKDLPVKLPNVKKYEPTGTGESPLAVIDKWVNVKCPQCGGKAKRETNTMPQWAGSSWYYLRYTDPENKKELATKDLMQRWLPVDVYFGGMEHTTLHLLYSRFWNLFLHDQGIVPVAEPYTKRVPHGIILAEDGEKMSKSRGNVVNPDEIIELYGADTMRIYELFLGPHEQTVSWNSRGIIGVRRFLEKVWRIAQSELKEAADLDTAVHKTIKKATEDIEDYRFNTAVSALMILMNEFEKTIPTKQHLQIFLRLLAPFAPHLAEELWRSLGNKQSVHLAPWPELDANFVKDEFITMAVQVNGRVRDTIRVAVSASEADARKTAESSPQVQKQLVGKTVAKFIYVPGKIINFVVL